MLYFFFLLLKPPRCVIPFSEISLCVVQNFNFRNSFYKDIRKKWDKKNLGKKISEILLKNI